MRKALAAVAVVALTGGCWLQPGFDAGRTNNNPGEATLTSGTVGALSVLWSAQLPASDLNAPVSVDGTLHVTARRTAAGGNRIFEVDAVTGAVGWQTDIAIPPGPWTAGGVPTEVYAPTFHDGHLLVPWWRNTGMGGGDGGVASIGLDGTTIGVPAGNPTEQVAVAGDDVWTRGRYVPIGSSGLSSSSISGPYSPALGLYSSYRHPGDFAVVGERIAWSRADSAYGFSAACPPNSRPPGGCAPDWRVALGGTATAPVAVGEGQVAYGDASGTVTVLDMATGAVAWSADAGGGISHKPAVSGEAIFAATDDGRLLAFDRDGCGAATCSPLWEAGIAAPTGQPLVAGDVVYVPAGTRVVAFPGDGCGGPTCQSLASVAAPSTITGGPIVHDGRLVVGTEDGELVAFGPGS